MRNPLTRGAVLKSVLLLAVAGSGLGAVAAQTKAPARPVPANPVLNEADQANLAATRSQLIDLLKMNPRMTSFIKRDPLLLADQEYVNRTNPKLAGFLQQHPEIAKNPEFYLFAEIADKGRGLHDVYIDDSAFGSQQRRTRTDDVLEGVFIFSIFVTIVSVLVWLLRVMLENRRWSRIFKVQTEIYNKLLDKFSSNEEMLAYIRSESGKRFLDSATLPAATGMQPHTPNPLARVLTPLQLGMVLALVGVGALYVKSSIPDALAPLSLVGTLALMAGLGLIISAGLAFGLAKHLGLLPQPGALPENGLGQHPDVPQV